MNPKIDRRTLLASLPLASPVLASGASQASSAQPADKAGLAGQKPIADRFTAAEPSATTQESIDAAASRAGDRVTMARGKIGPVTIREVNLQGELALLRHLR